MVLKGQILKGLGWAVALRGFVKILALVKLVVLARLLTPEAFGQFGIAALALTLFETITETGVNQILIYSNRKLTDLVDSAWIVSIARGIIISFLVALSAYPLAWYFNDSMVVPLILLVAVTPLLRGFVNPMIVTFVKELDFRREFLFRSVSASVDFVVAVTIGFLTHSPIAFVAALLVSALVDVALSFFLFSIHPRLRFVRSYLSEILGYGKWITLSGIAYWIASELDDFVAGRLYGITALGGYQIGYKIATLPVTEISGTVNQVSFPVLSKTRSEQRTFMKIFWSSMLFTNAIGFIIALILVLFPADVVSLTLGSQWGGVVPLVRILAVFGLLRTIESSLQPLVLSLGKPQIASVGNLLKVAGLAVGLFFFSRDGIHGVALAALLSGFVVIPYYAVIIPRLLR